MQFEIPQEPHAALSHGASSTLLMPATNNVITNQDFLFIDIPPFFIRLDCPG
jgi:hypothetical protein